MGFKSAFLGIASFLLVLFSIVSGEARGEEFKLTPSIGIKEVFNDNVFLTEKNKEEDLITTIFPGIEISNRTERLNINLNARWDIITYASNEELNFLNHNYKAMVTYSLYPALRLSAEGSVTRDFSIDRDIEVTGLVTKALKRYKYNFSGGAQYALTEKTRAEFSYSHERVDYSHDPEYLDTKSNGFNLGLTHDLSEYILNTVGRINFGYFRYEFQENKVDYYYGTLGIGLSLTEKWSLLVDGGASYTISEFEAERLKFVPYFPFLITVREREKEEGTGWVAQATISYRGERTARGERTRGDLTFNHRVMPASGTVGVTERTSVSLSLFSRFTYELSGRLSASYYINKAERGKYSQSSINETTFIVSPQLRYEFTDDIALEASHSFYFGRDREAHADVSRNLFIMSLVFKHRLLE
ncbi:MAG: hypothetical protein QXH17_09630 [Candidatus Bathyarchaeia archaeon]